MLREWWWVGLSRRLGVWWVGVGSVWLHRWVGRCKLAGIGLGCVRGWWIVCVSEIGVWRAWVLEGLHELRVLTLLKVEECGGGRIVRGSIAVVEVVGLVVSPPVAGFPSRVVRRSSW